MTSTINLLRLLADPTRLRLLLLLEEEELSVAELQKILNMGQSRISSHLAQLKRAGVVAGRRAGKNVYYGATKIAGRNGARGRVQQVIETLARDTYQAPRGPVDPAHQEGGVGVAMDALEIHGHVDVDDVAVDQGAVVGNPVADDLVDRRAHRLGVAPVVEGARVGPPGDALGVDQLVELVCGDARGHGRAGGGQDLCRDPTRLAASLEQFVGNPAYGLPQLRGDLERFVFLLGGSDGEQLFGP